MGGAGGPPGAGAGAAAAAVVIAQPEGLLSKIWWYISTYGRMGYDRFLASRKPQPPTLEELVAMISKQAIIYVPPPWVEHIRDSLRPDEYKSIIDSGTRALSASLEVLRNLLLYKLEYAKKRNVYDPSLRNIAERLFESVLLYNVYTYYKYALRAPYKDIAALRRNISPNALAANSQQISENTGVIFPKVDELPSINDQLNAIITMNPELAAAYRLQSGGGAGASARFPTLDIEVDADEDDAATIAGKMEPAIQIAEDVLDGRKDLWAGPAAKEEYTAAKIDFRRALHALVAERPILRNRASAILSTIRNIPGSIMGAGAVGAAVAASGGGGGGAGGGGDGNSDRPAYAEHRLARGPNSVPAAASSGAAAFGDAAGSGVGSAAAAPAPAFAAAPASSGAAAFGGGGFGGAALSAAPAQFAAMPASGGGGGGGWPRLAAGAGAGAGGASAAAPAAISRANGKTNSLAILAAQQAAQQQRTSNALGREQAVGAAAAAEYAPPDDTGKRRRGPGQGGGARRTRRLRHQKTRRHAHKHRSHKAKTHHRSHARKTRRQH